LLGTHPLWYRCNEVSHHLREVINILHLFPTFFILLGAISAANLEPPNRFGNADLRTGKIDYFLPLKLVPVQDNPNPLPFSLRYCTQPNLGLLSAKWSVPLLEARIIQKNPRAASILLPCGKYLHLRNSVHGVFSTRNQAWQLSGTGTKKVLEGLSWKLDFEKGRLKRMEDPSGHVWSWIRDNDGQVKTIEGNSSKLTFTYQEKGKLESATHGEDSWIFGDSTGLADNILTIRKDPAISPWLSAQTTTAGKISSLNFKEGPLKYSLLYSSQTNILIKDHQFQYNIQTRPKNHPYMERKSLGYIPQEYIYDFDALKGMKREVKDGEEIITEYNLTPGKIFMTPKSVSRRELD